MKELIYVFIGGDYLRMTMRSIGNPIMAVIGNTNSNADTP